MVTVKVGVTVWVSVIVHVSVMVGEIVPVSVTVSVTVMVQVGLLVWDSVEVEVCEIVQVGVIVADSAGAVLVTVGVEVKEPGSTGILRLEQPETSMKAVNMKMIFVLLSSFNAPYDFLAYAN